MTARLITIYEKVLIHDKEVITNHGNFSTIHGKVLHFTTF